MVFPDHHFRHITSHTNLPVVILKEKRASRKEILTAIILTKSFSPSVSKIVTIVCLAMVSSKPFMLPLMSTKITISLGDVAAWIYLRIDVG